MTIPLFIRSLVTKRAMVPGYLPDSVLEAAAGLASLRGRVSQLSTLERLLATIRHKQPDRIPVAPLTNAVARHITGVSFPDYSRRAEKAAEVFCAAVDFIGCELIVLLIDLSVEAADFGQEIIYPAETTAHPDYMNPAIRKVDDYLDVKPVDFWKGGRMKEFVKLCRIMVERKGLSSVISGFVFGPLGVLSMMRGAGLFFRDCLNHPGQVLRACEAVTETLVDFAEAQCDTGLPAVTLDTLYASRNALPRKVWENLEGPFVREIARAIRKKGGFVGIHNCGHGSYFDSQIRFMEPDFISYAHLPDDCKDNVELKKRYGNAVTLVGNVPTPLLVNGTPQEVMDECRRQIDVLGRDGGYVLAPGCEYPPNLPLTNAFAMVRAAMN
jgi:uroporphyrinogen decarboxylase